MALLMKWVLMCSILNAVKLVTTQEMDVTIPEGSTGICKSKRLFVLKNPISFEHCILIQGNIQVYVTRFQDNFTKILFPNVREITGHLAVNYALNLRSLGDLLPKLTRIRGSELIWNYALIIDDARDLREVGLKNLIRIDRGSVAAIIPPGTCYLDTVNWNAISTHRSHFLLRNKMFLHEQWQLDLCEKECSCSNNYCWNNIHCQRVIEGPGAEVCHEQCLGCSDRDSKLCSVCRYYTHGRKCVASCPDGTIPMEISNYCVTLDQCHSLDSWLFNGTCVDGCPIDYKVQISEDNVTTCEPCLHCDEICGNIFITSIYKMQSAQKCVYVHGYLIIQVRRLKEAMETLRFFLNRIKEVRDYVVIFDSYTITSLDFLPSLTLIEGQNLKNGTYSLMVYDTLKLDSLFTDNVTQHLKINAGTGKFYNNPNLCKKEINKIGHVFPIKLNEITVPEGLNGYSGGCTHIDLKLQVKEVGTTDALVTFQRHGNSSISYSLLYIRLLPGDNSGVVPESCSDTPWNVVNVEYTDQSNVSVLLNDLRPVSNYVCCIETYDSDDRHLTRSAIVKFSTKVGRPPAPFLKNVFSESPDSIVVHWVNHMAYNEFITHYELDVMFIDFDDDDVNIRNHCEDPVPQDILLKYFEKSPHEIAELMPPKHYTQSCSKECDILPGKSALVVDWDPCQAGLDCEGSLDTEEEVELPPDNKLMKDCGKMYYKSMSIAISRDANQYTIRCLAPYRKYKIRLRGCIDMSCSQSNRAVVRTRPLKKADLASIVKIEANNGTIVIEWEAPKVTNGPVLSYTVQVKPVIDKYEIGVFNVPEELCLFNHERNVTLYNLVADSYNVRVCTTTLKPDSTCTEWFLIPAKQMVGFWFVWLLAIAAAILIFVGSCVCQMYCPLFQLSRNRSFRRHRRESTPGDTDTIVDESPDNPFVNPVPSTSRAAMQLELKTFKQTEEIKDITEITEPRETRLTTAISKTYDLTTIPDSISGDSAGSIDTETFGSRKQLMKPCSVKGIEVVQIEMKTFSKSAKASTKPESKEGIKDTNVSVEPKKSEGDTQPDSTSCDSAGSLDTDGSEKALIKHSISRGTSVEDSPEESNIEQVVQIEMKTFSEPAKGSTKPESSGGIQDTCVDVEPKKSDTPPDSASCDSAGSLDTDGSEKALIKRSISRGTSVEDSPDESHIVSSDTTGTETVDLHEDSEKEYEDTRL